MSELKYYLESDLSLRCLPRERSRYFRSLSRERSRERSLDLSLDRSRDLERCRSLRRSLDLDLSRSRDRSLRSSFDPSRSPA